MVEVMLIDRCVHVFTSSHPSPPIALPHLVSPLSLPYDKVPRPSADGSPVPGLLRIFIEYQDVAAATAAATELNGKPFAGQTVQVR
jgi:hypothetical protein